MSIYVGLLDIFGEELAGAGYQRVLYEGKDAVFPQATGEWRGVVYVGIYKDNELIGRYNLFNVKYLIAGDMITIHIEHMREIIDELIRTKELPDVRFEKLLLPSGYWKGQWQNDVCEYLSD